MDFCVISPTAGLDRYSSLSKTHLVLPQVMDEAYWKFYKERWKEGDTIIVDNGSYEGQKFNLERFLFTLELFERKCIGVLPDYLLEPWEKTWHASIAFLDRWEETYSGMEWMGVAQCSVKDVNGPAPLIEKFLNDDRIDWIGLPRALATDVYGIWMRASFCHLIKREKRSRQVFVHALGMAAGDVREISLLEDAGCDSIDSSAPVWRGWNAFKIGDKNWDGRACEFTIARTPSPGNSEDNIILNNLEVCGVDTSSRRNSNPR